MARSDFRMVNKGYRELSRRLVGMDRKMRRKIVAKAMRAGAKVMVKALRSAAPKDTGKASKAIGTKIKTYRGSQITVAITGERFTSRRGKEKEKKSKWGAPHLHLIEYGTAERFHTGEKEARRVLKGLGHVATPQTLKEALASTGAFGRHSAVGRVGRTTGNRLGFSRTVRETQAAIKRGNLLARFGKIGRDIRKGKPTGRVRAKPFFAKTVRATAAAAQAAQVAVLRREIEAAARAA